MHSHTHTHIECVVSGTAGVASLQMAGAAHTLPVVIQYVLYNSREQQAPSLCMEKKHTHAHTSSHSGSKHIDVDMQSLSIHTHVHKNILDFFLSSLETLFFTACTLLATKPTSLLVISHFSDSGIQSVG